MGRGVVGRDVLFYIISSYLETGGAACGGHRTHTTGKGDSGHSRSSTVRKQDPPSQAQGSWSRSSNTEPQSPYPNPSPLSQRSLSHQTSPSQHTQPRAPYRRDYRLKTGQGSEQQLLQVALLSLPQGQTEGIKGLGASLGQQVEEFHVLAETARLGLRE